MYICNRFRYTHYLLCVLYETQIQIRNVTQPFTHIKLNLNKNLIFPSIFFQRISHIMSKKKVLYLYNRYSRVHILHQMFHWHPWGKCIEFYSEKKITLYSREKAYSQRIITVVLRKGRPLFFTEIVKNVNFACHFSKYRYKKKIAYSTPRGKSSFEIFVLGLFSQSIFERNRFVKVIKIDMARNFQK